MKFKDYYEILGVARDADADAIKKAYRKLVRRFHPDVSQEHGAEERIKEINEAYEVLKDPEKRREYDQLGAYWRGGEEFDVPPEWFKPDAGGFGFKTNADANTGFGAGGFESFGQFFEELFSRRHPHGAGGSAQRQPRAQDLTAEARISLEDSFFGRDRIISVASGPHQPPRQIQMTVPKGVTEGQVIRLQGQGAGSASNGQAGDLLLRVAFVGHQLYTVSGRDIHLDVPITPWEAALGAKIEVPTLGGKVTVAIKAVAQGGQRLKLKARGLPGSPPGDQILTLRLVLPPADNDEQRTAYRRLAEQLPFDPRANWA